MTFSIKDNPLHDHMESIGSCFGSQLEAFNQDLNAKITKLYEHYFMTLFVNMEEKCNQAKPVLNHIIEVEMKEKNLLRERMNLRRILSPFSLVVSEAFFFGRLKMEIPPENMNRMKTPQNEN
ncbi:hypothetical protein VNO77_15504 [Canavalia gladiata]|uniref:Uncharacterized protein n=1 Tax=Canavalia gladiata TaxID=3824 RepID=A0AAN9M426_CANGL